MEIVIPNFYTVVIVLSIAGLVLFWSVVKYAIKQFWRLKAEVEEEREG